MQVVLQHGSEPMGRRGEKLWLKTDGFGCQVEGGVKAGVGCELQRTQNRFDESLSLIVDVMWPSGSSPCLLDFPTMMGCAPGPVRQSEPFLP